ncbi:MAG TPA: 50S ribosomal protein L11 methyltransferase, partial [Planctomycetaceae bacterium]|nr:50S ribosomal protein L11 methyltransferase [Planctomycetaceae bacterium]
LRLPSRPDCVHDSSQNELREIYREIEVELPSDDSLPFVQVLDEGLALPDLSGYYEVLYDETRPRESEADGDRTRIVLYFPIHAELAVAQIELVLEALGLDDYRLNEKRIARKDYLEAYKQYYEPFQISPRLVIVPSWDRGSEREAAARKAAGETGVLSLYLDPGLAFGTGKHPTTQLCLEYLDEAFASPDRAPRRLIDAGAGSGILALGALLFGAESVYAFDIDGNATVACRQNLELNAVSGELIFEHGGFDLPGLAERPADLLLGNLTAAVLLQNQAFVDASQARRMILSGILTEQQDRVVEAFTSTHWDFCSGRESDGWVLLEFEARSA